jgi:mitogen-activated protein kinase kinase kinase
LLKKENELHILEKIKHDYVVIYKGCKISVDKKNLYIFMEYMPGGSVASMLKQYGAFNEQVIYSFDSFKNDSCYFF